MAISSSLLCLQILLSGSTVPSPTSVANPLVTAIASQIGPLIVGLILGWAGPRLFQKRKVISFSVDSLPLLQFRRGMQPVMFLTVPASLLPGSDPTNTSLVQIDNAYLFEITFTNVGHEGVTSPELLIILDPAATILDFDCVPASSVARPITMERDQQHRKVLRVLPAFISRGEKLVVNLVSTGNSSRTYRVEITGLDVRARDAQKNRGVLSRLSSPLLPFFSAAHSLPHYCSSTTYS
jgi:hypothetical protein